jgi:hypothetical protein
MVLWLGGTFSVALFNRPRLFVAPALRREPGLLVEMWVAFRNR